MDSAYDTLTAHPSTLTGNIGVISLFPNVDEIGFFDDALKKASAPAKIKDARVVSYAYTPKTKTNIYAADKKILFE
ncbi:MAG: hypothetical protein PVI11_00800 [Candidatus Aminicenantes bacterium]